MTNKIARIYWRVSTDMQVSEGVLISKSMVFS
jgi:hypothetical protein